MRQQAAFGSFPSAEAYDIQYPDKNYEAEAKLLAQTAAELSPAGCESVLDVACGTGGHLEFLADHFSDVAGLDLSPDQLGYAAHKLPESVSLHQADMRDFDLGRKFDVVACLFGAIGYAADKEGLQRSVSAMTRHIKPGGLLVIEPWLHPHEFIMDEELRKLDLVTDNGAELIRRDVIGPMPEGDEGPVPIEMSFMHSRRGPDGQYRIDVFQEHHVLGLFTQATYREALQASGATEIIEQPPWEGLPTLRTWLIGRMPTAQVVR